MAITKAIVCLIEEIRGLGAKMGKMDCLEPAISGITRELHEYLQFIKLSSTEEKRTLNKMVTNIGGTSQELSKI